MVDRTVLPDGNSRPASSAMSVLGVVALVLLIVGGLNWALVGLFNFDLVAAIFGDMTTLSRIVYVLVGLAALYALSLFPRVARPVH
jgi:uncharacterized membrane protein YuzA (DUF378 family)